MGQLFHANVCILIEVSPYQLIDDDSSLHHRMVNAVIRKGTGCVKCFCIRTPCCNVATVKTVVIRGNCMRDIVSIRPGNSCAFCNGKACF